jgi:activating signal cointegrator 1
MKALTLTQPWATLVAIGAKRIETRSWSTNYRGPLLIHAAKSFPRDCQDLCFEPSFRKALLSIPCPFPRELPRGVIVARCKLVDCVPTKDVPYHKLDLAEQDFGNYDDGRFAFYLKEIVPVEPIVIRGMLGLWEVPALALTILTPLPDQGEVARAQASAGEG